MHFSHRFFPRALLLAAGFASLACADGSRVVVDGWHEGPEPAVARAFFDSLVGVSGGTPAVRYVGLDRHEEPDAWPDGRSGARLGDVWGKQILEQANPSVVVGFPGSAVTNAAARHLAAAGIPIIAPNATATTAPDIEAFIFRLLPSEDVQAKVLVDFIADSTEATRLAVVFTGDAYGVGILRGVRGAAAARGVQLVDEVELPTGACVDPSAAATLATRAMLRRSQPTALVIALPLTTATCVLQEAWAADPALWILGSDALDAWVVDQWLTRVAPTSRVRIATGWVPRTDSATTAFVTRIAARRGRRPQGADALHADALALATLALRETDGRPQAVRRWLQGLGTERPAFRGLTGAISFADDAAPRLTLRAVSP